MRASGNRVCVTCSKGRASPPYADWLRRSVRRTALPFRHVTDRSRTLPPGRSTSFRWGDRPPQAFGSLGSVGSPRPVRADRGKGSCGRSAAETGGKGAGERHRQHVRSDTGPGLTCKLGVGNRGLAFMLGERNEPPYPSPSVTGPFPPDAPLRSAGGTDHVIATPATLDVPLRSAGGTELRFTLPQFCTSRFKGFWH